MGGEMSLFLNQTGELWVICRHSQRSIWSPLRYATRNTIPAIRELRWQSDSVEFPDDQIETVSEEVGLS